MAAIKPGRCPELWLTQEQCDHGCYKLHTSIAGGGLPLGALSCIGKADGKDGTEIFLPSGTANDAFCCVFVCTCMCFFCYSVKHVCWAEAEPVCVMLYDMYCPSLSVMLLTHAGCSFDERFCAAQLQISRDEDKMQHVSQIEESQASKVYSKVQCKIQSKVQQVCGCSISSTKPRSWTWLGFLLLSCTSFSILTKADESLIFFVGLSFEGR